ncbi:hypothetical protein O4H49_02025 [Kiloniella laminariae]|uniref:STAS/SEC14 domain-containing protein n=1 Tax=Kiloniella laminariae TaxID=454162 RepID=A0ABT4LEK6_9PROT|nr:hypothetical protein [Kiloniella laminariae]MCZ4279536.1 hypothetical protein [Kiloniella laminariae]
MTYIGHLHTDQLLAELKEIWQQIPNLENYDNVIDLRFHRGNASWHTVKEIGDQWDHHFGGKGPKRRTAFLSDQKSFNILIKAIRAVLPNQVFNVFTDREKAVAWIERQRHTE